MKRVFDFGPIPLDKDGTSTSLPFRLRVVFSSDSGVY